MIMVLTLLYGPVVSEKRYLSPSKKPTIAKPIDITRNQTRTGANQSPATDNLFFGASFPLPMDFREAPNRSG
jgi:hypothetical protein